MRRSEAESARVDMLASNNTLTKFPRAIQAYSWAAMKDVAAAVAVWNMG